MTWQVQDKEAMQKFLRESILQLCRINIGMPGSYEVDGIICITRGGSSDLHSNTDEDQIVVKVHEQITPMLPENRCPPGLDACFLREYLASQGIAARLIRSQADANLPLNLKRKANDENDNAIIDVTCSNDSKDLLTGTKWLQCDTVKRYCDKFDGGDRVHMRRPYQHMRVAKVSAGSVNNIEEDSSRSELYSCGSCLLDFNSWISLQGHFQQSHTSSLKHYCRSCAVGFLSAADLSKHNSSVHNKQIPSTGVVVSRRKQNKPRRGITNDDASALGDCVSEEGELVEDWLKTKQMRRNDMTSVSSHQPVLQKRPLTKILRDNNMTVVKHQPSDDVNCNTAGVELVSERICPHCTSFFVDFSEFSIHCQAVHHRYPCPHCLQTFTQRVNRDRHLYSHTGERPYECATCGDGFTRRDALRKHQLKCSHNVSTFEDSEPNVDGTIPFSDDDSDVDASMNNDCGLDLSVLSDYSRTLKDESKEAKSGFEDDSAMCVVSKQNMPKSFTHSHPPTGAIVRHSPLSVMPTERSESESFACLQSSDTTDAHSAASLQPVTEGRWYSCDTCHASIVGAAAFELHCRSEHRRTPCVYCGKTFSQKGNMERHQRRHTGERPFACPHCSCSYTRKETLKVHVNQAHPAAVTSDAAAGYKEPSLEFESNRTAGHLTADLY